LTISELLDRTFSLYRTHFVTFVGIAAIPVAVVVGLQVIVEVGFRSMPPGLLILSSLALFVLYLVSSMVTHGATVVAVSHVQIGHATSITAAYDGIRGRIGELVVIGLNIGVRAMLGLILLIIPGIYLILRYALAVPVAVIEQAGVSDSLARSGFLTRGHIGRVFLIYLLLVLLTYAGIAVVQVPIFAIALSQSLNPADPPLWIRILSALGAFAVNTLVGPLMTIGLSLVYYDERVRKEGFDLEHMLQQLDPSGLNTPGVA
jgi:hypothetical protein